MTTFKPAPQPSSQYILAALLLCTPKETQTYPLDMEKRRSVPVASSEDPSAFTLNYFIGGAWLHKCWMLEELGGRTLPPCC